MEKTLNPKLRWVEQVAHLMDEKFRLPGTNFRFGLDPILNLIPVLGDMSGFAVSTALMLTMARHGASRKVLILMTLNIILDTTIGAIPILGNIFDFAYKSNTRNIKLLREHYEEGKHTGSGRGIIIWLIVILMMVVLLFLYAMWMLLSWLFSGIF